MKLNTEYSYNSEYINVNRKPTYRKPAKLVANYLVVTKPLV